MKGFVINILFVAVVSCTLSSCMGGKRPSTPHRPYDRPSINAHQNSDLSHNNRGESILYELIEIPRLLSNQPEQIISHLGYTVSYNYDTCLANWVAYELTFDEVQGTFTSSKKFLPDPLIHTRQADNDDYKHSGWDRGHMCPAADMKWDKQAIDESYYFSNICPQNPNLNGGDWKALEEKCRSLASDYGKLYIVCGAIVGEGTNGTLGDNRVTIPDAFYKVLLIETLDDYKGIGFYFENKAGHHNLSYYARTVDDIENLTNIDFFYALPDVIEIDVESQYDLEAWHIK